MKSKSTIPLSSLHQSEAKASASYRKMMGSLISTLAGMELAFLEGDMDKVKEIVESMREIKKEGHDKFMEDE